MRPNPTPPADSRGSAGFDVDLQHHLAIKSEAPEMFEIFWRVIDKDE
jgi:hypothetical protein